MLGQQRRAGNSHLAAVLAVREHERHLWVTVVGLRVGAGGGNLPCSSKGSATAILRKTDGSAVSSVHSNIGQSAAYWLHTPIRVGNTFKSGNFSQGKLTVHVTCKAVLLHLVTGAKLQSNGQVVAAR